MSHVHRLRTTDRIPSAVAQDGGQTENRFFVTVNLRRRVEPFRASEYSLRIEILESARRRLGFLLCGYVLMPDHWHAIIFPPHPLTISQIMEAIKVGSTRRLNTRRKGGGEIWQPRFFDHALRTVEKYHQCVDYMHLNPVRRGLVEKPEDWKWSSIHEYVISETRAEESGKECRPPQSFVLVIDKVSLPTDGKARI